MYQETVGYQGNRSFLFVVVIFVLLLLVGLADLLSSLLGALYANVIALLCFALLSLGLYRYFVCEFKYSVIAQEFVMSRITGRRERVVARIDLSQVVCLAPTGSPQAADYKGLRATAVGTSFRRFGRKYALVAGSGSEYVRVIFQPSKKLLGILEDQMAKREPSGHPRG